MMQEGKYKNDSTVYTNDSLWVNYFCGLAILPLDFNGTTARPSPPRLPSRA